MKGSVSRFMESRSSDVEDRDEAWFMEQLKRARPEAYVHGRDIKILCPFHADNDPSCGVSRTKGIYNCWSCGAHGHWNKLAARLGIAKLPWGGDDEPLTDLAEVSTSMVRAFTRMGVTQTRASKRGDMNRPLVEPWPPDRGVRGLTGALLAGLGAVRVIDLCHNVERIGLPVRSLDGELYGYQCRALDPADAEPKYVPLAADQRTWREKELPAKSALFLVERVLDEAWDRIVLVEGPFDALRLYAAGIPAIAILGTSNWTAEKAATLVGLGLKHVLVMRENDGAGHEAQATILNSLVGGVKATGFKLPAGTKDPGDLTPKQLTWLAQRVRDL